MTEEQPKNEVFKNPDNKQSQEELATKEERCSATDLAKACFLRANNFELQGKYKEAEESYKKAIALDDQNPLYLDDYNKLQEKMEERE